eukprot:m51a1_g3507 hypothetical protein (577) ;mRNA; r:863725-865749
MQDVRTRRSVLGLAAKIVVGLVGLSALTSVALLGLEIHDQNHRILDAQKAAGRFAWWFPPGRDDVYGSAVLPAVYLVPETARTPVKEQGNRGTCWIFSTFAALEASYRKNGYEKGYLEEDEYVPFSEQAYGIGYVNFCKNVSNNDPHCVAGPARGATRDGRSEWLYYVKQVQRYVLPDALCPYQPKEADEMVCPGLEQAVRTNPIKFEIRGVETAHTISTIKRMIYEKKVGLVWSHGSHLVTYEIPCTDNMTGVYGTEQCQKCLFPCAASSNGCCGRLVHKGNNQQGVYMIHKTPHRSGGHGIHVVGWNDEFRIQTGLPGTSDYIQGGFILKNSYGTDAGHSAGYWAAKTSIANENMICPVERSSRTWVPADEACMLQKKDPVACAPGLKKLVRGQWIEGATVLQCNPSGANAKLLGWDGCKKGMRYVAVMRNTVGDTKVTAEIKVTAPAHSDGYVHFHLVEWNPANLTQPATVIETGATSWWGIENLLTPVTVIGNHRQCGYYFYPYETFIQATMNYPITGIDTPMVMYFDIDWKDSSYVYGTRRWRPEYQWLAKSLAKFSEVQFDGPWDWNAKI